MDMPKTNMKITLLIADLINQFLRKEMETARIGIIDTNHLTPKARPE